MKKGKLVMASVVLGALLVGSVLLYSTQGESPYLSASCAALHVTRNSIPTGSTITSYTCGRGTASDGRLRITVNNYTVEDGRTIQWLCPAGYNAYNGTSCSSSGVYLLANVTVANVGTGNSSVGPDLYVNASDGALPEVTSEYGANAYFPGEHPNGTVPITGGAFLPPGTARTYWFVFYMAGAAAKDIPSIKLHLVVLPENEYGGDWEGGGSFRCIPVGCDQTMTDLIAVV